MDSIRELMECSTSAPNAVSDLRLFSFISPSSRLVEPLQYRFRMASVHYVDPFKLKLVPQPPNNKMWTASGSGHAVAQGSLHGCLGMVAEARDVSTSLGFNMGACNWKR